MPEFKIEESMSLAVCKDCPLNETPKVFSYLTNQDKVDVLVIGQSPGYDEIRLGRPFIGRSGELINPILTEYTPDVAYINVIACRPLDTTAKDRPPTTDELRCCRERFQSDFTHVITTHQPRSIVVLGVPAKKEMGRLFKNFPDYGKLPIHYLEHPSFILRNPYLKPRYLTQWHNLMKSAFGGKSDEIVSSFVSYTDNVKHQFLSDVYSSKRLGVDIETNSLDMFNLNFIIGTVAVCCDKATYFFDCRNKDIREFDVLLEALKDNKVQKIFADILFDVVALTQYKVEVNNYSDLFPLAFMYDNTFNEYSLEAIAMRYMPDLAGYKAKFKSTVVNNAYLEVPTEELMEYNCFDAYCTKVLYDFIHADMPEKARKVFDKITNKLLPVLVVLKCSGMKVDQDLLGTYKTLFEQRYKELSQYFVDKYGITSINSTPQIKKWLFTTLKLKSIKKTPAGEPSTDKEVLETFAAQVPDVRLLYEARRVANILAYFVPSIQESLDDQDLVHPNYKHYGIQSYRLSCLRPNLQGIPRDETGIEILDKNPLRRLFKARLFDSYMIEFDYSQQEVRIVAELAHDVKMLEAFAKGEDIHTFVGALVFGKPMDKITKMERQIAKGCVFGAIFGASSKEMSIRLHISDKQAQAYLDRFFTIFSSVDTYIRRQHTTLIKSKGISTILGRPRKFVKFDTEESKREAANHTIQAVAADITFLSLIKIHEGLVKAGLLNKEAFLIHSVHDSILLDVRKNALKQVIDLVSETMCSVPKMLDFKVAFPVDYKVGKRWGISEKLEDILKGE